MKFHLWTSVLTASAMMMLLNACAPSIKETNICTKFSVITVSKDDTLTPRTGEDILRHNERYEAICN